MPLDAICLQAVVNEISPIVVGSRIEKIQQPARDQLVLVLRGNRRLFICANPNQPRIHMTELLRDNPSQPPMFCMLLRKHIGNGRIVALEQQPLERVVTLHIEATDEMGEQSRFCLILEAMGRNTNLILTDRDNRIVDCLRRIDLESSQTRQVLPGLFYQMPPAQEKLDPLTVTEDDFFRAVGNGEERVESRLTAAFVAISPLVAREIIFDAHGDSDSCSVDDALWRSFADWQRKVKENSFTPNVLLRQGRAFDFTYRPVAQYGSYGESVEQESFSALLDTFYVQREQAERVKQRGQELVKAATNARDRVRRKIALREKEYAQTQDRETLRIRGELITANLYRMERGQRVLQAQNYYEEDCPTIDIPLDVRLSPQENAAKYFKQYNKAKTAEKMLTELLTQGREELQYLESVLQELQLAESEQDFMDIRAELESGGYLRKQGKKGGSFQRPSKPREFRSTAGLRILVGRNNRQNDRLTAKDAQKWDIWFHTQKIHGSHVILCTDGLEADEQSILEAAQIAAYYSQGREGDKVAVDYTPVKFVKKPASARPGMVIYTTYKTLFVTPDGELVKKLSVK